MGSTDIPTKRMYRNRLVTASTAVVTSTGVICLSTIISAVPGCKRSTVGEEVHIPIRKPGNPLGIYVCYDSPCTGSTAAYAQVDVKYAPSSDGAAWGGGGHGETIGSTAEIAWAHYRSTAAFTATSTEAEAFMLWLDDTYKFAQNFGATSSNSIDQYQNFIKIMVGYSTANSNASHDALSTNAPIGGYEIMPIEFMEHTT